MMGFSAGSELQDCPKFPHGSSAMHAAGRRSDRGKIQVDRVETNNRRMSTGGTRMCRGKPAPSLGCALRWLPTLASEFFGADSASADLVSSDRIRSHRVHRLVFKLDRV